MLLPGGRWVAAWFVALLMLALGILALSPGTSVPTPDRPNATPVGREAAGSGSPESEATRFVGVVLPYEAADVSAGLDGYIAEVNVHIGDRIRRGDVLAVIESLTITQTDLAIAEADLRAAEATAKALTIEQAHARERLQRASLLNQKHLVSVEQMAEAEHQVQLAAARVGSAESIVAQKRAVVGQRAGLLARTKVKAPFDGVVAIRYVDRGWHVGPVVPIVRLVRTSPLKLRFAVPAAESSRMKVGVPIVALLDEVGLTLDGVIEAIAPEIDAASQFHVVEAVLNMPNAVASATTLPGRVARVTIASERSAPREAVTFAPVR